MDGRALRAMRPRRGIAIYLEQLLAELARLHPEDEYRVHVPGAARTGAVPENVEVVGVGGSGRALHAAAALAGRPRLDRLLRRPDLIWAPAPAPLAVSRETPFVLTMHDLSFVHRPSDYGLYERFWHGVARPHRLARRAQRVLAVSDVVRGELLDEWDLSPERVRTVRSGPGRAPAPGGPLAGGAPGGPRPAQVLAVGALEPRKQPGLLVEAHRRAVKRGLRAGLAFVGDGPLRAELEQSGATVLGRLRDTELDAAYSEALCLACVSREEGFGFTPLEAIAAGVPAVVSDLPVFRETLGDAALMVPPNDADALAHALLRLEREPELRESVVAAGRERVQLLSWERAARKTRAVFEEALS
ncbi:MAG TPA: glycosyltransferase family 1 protein [Thermoleophilaceae bacterium]|nr:glycosyltransferase family 1 protein [Thermoleophilaceae bacterium]